MGALETKLAVSQALEDLSFSKALSKISVSDIVAAVDMNRKTFYYHFADKSQLIAWTFRYDIAQVLRESLPEENLVYLRKDDKACEGLPYYTFVKNGVRSIDGTAFIHAFVRALESRRSFYAQALADNSSTGLAAYLRRLYIPALRKDVSFILSNRLLETQHQDFLAAYHFEALLGYLITHLSNKEESMLKDFGPFENIMHTSIADAIERHQHLRAAEHTMHEEMRGLGAHVRA